MGKGVISMGITCPIIREGDNLIDIVTNAVLNEQNIVSGKGEKIYTLQDKDVIGITESVIARAAGLYITVDDIADDIRKKFGDNPTICLTYMIYSRNRFSMILKGIARAAKKLILVMEFIDEVGNPRYTNPFTGVDIEEYYKEICKSENCDVEILHQLRTQWNDNPELIYPGVDFIKDKIDGFIDCSLHLPNGTSSSLAIHSWYCFYPLYTLAEICSDKNPDFGLLGTNKATEERLKLFPTKEEAQRICDGVKKKIYEITGKDIIVMAYGDGSYKDLDAGIWEMADPVSSPGYTDEELLNSTPNEIKVKAFADDKYKNLNGQELEDAIKNEIKLNKGKNLVGQMTSQGTTPRRYINLLASLMDLTSGSGERCTPIILIKNYFN